MSLVEGHLKTLTVAKVAKHCVTYDICIKNAIQSLPVHIARMIEHSADVQFQPKFGASKTD